MAQTETNTQEIQRIRRGPPSVRLPLIGTKVNLPDRAGLLWYAGIGGMAAVEIVEWPIALIIAGTHFVANHSHSRDVQELAEGIDAGA